MDFAILPNPSVVAVRTDLFRIAPKLDRQKLLRDGSRQVHWSAVDADYEASPSQKRDQLKKISLVHLGSRIQRKSKVHFGLSHHDHRPGSKRTTQCIDLGW